MWVGHFVAHLFSCWSVGSKLVKVQLSTDRKRSYDWLTASKPKWLVHCLSNVCMGCYSIPGILSKWSIPNMLSDKMRIYLLLMRLCPSQKRKLTFTAQWKLTANQLELMLTLALNVRWEHSMYSKDQPQWEDWSDKGSAVGCKWRRHVNYPG